MCPWHNLGFTFQAANALNMFENYLKKHPETYVMDPLPGVHKLLLRNQTYDLLQEHFKQDGEAGIYVLLYTAWM